MSQLVFSVLKKRISIIRRTITYHNGSGQKFEDMEPEKYLLLRTFIYLTEKKKVVDAPD